MMRYSPFAGVLEVICGPMFSGKSEELIRRLRRAQIARQRVQVFKARLDVRYSTSHIVSHSDQTLQAVVVGSSEELLRLLDDRVEVVGVDEVQFFDAGIIEACERLANMGKRVIVAGLDLDYRGLPFDPVPALMAVADMVKSMCLGLREQSGIGTVCLSGGVFQNRLLTEKAISLLEKEGFGVYINQAVPAGDGGVSFGQAVMALEALERGA